MSIIPDQPSSRDSPTRPRRPGSSLLVGLLAFALVVVLVRTTTPVAEPPAPDSTTSTTEAAVPESEPLANLVPEFDGTLHAIERSDGFNIVSWNSEQPSSQTQLSEGLPDDLAFDAGGNLVGVALRDSSSGAGTLFVGDESGLVQMGFEVSSFAWHQTEPAVMAAISQPFGSDEPDLVTLDFDTSSGPRSSVRTVTTLEPNDIVLAFDTWGFLIRRQEGARNRILLLDENGEQEWARPAHWAYASPTGDILLSFYSNETREFRAIRPTTPLTDAGAWFELPSLGVTAVGWSTRAQVAVVTFQGSGAESRLLIYDSSGSLLEELPLRWRVWGAEWSRNGRFVVMPGVHDGQHTVLFYDTEEKRLTPVAFEGQVVTAVVAN